MASLPYMFKGIVYDTDGSTAIEGAIVRVRNNTSNDVLTATSNSSGQYVFELANFTNGYLQSDSVTVYVYYGAYYVEYTFDISDDTHESNLTLEAITDPGTVDYTTVSSVWDNLDDATSADITADRIVAAIQRAEGEIDEHCNTKFVATTVTDEVYHYNQSNTWKSMEQMSGLYPTGRNDYMNQNYNDVLKFNKAPIISITSLYKNTASASAADSWSELDEQTGSGGDFLILNTNTGTVAFLSDKPRYGKRACKVTYIYGTSTVPKNVERLTILLAVKDIIMSKMHGSQFEGIDPITLEGVGLGKAIVDSTKYLQQINMEIAEIYKELPIYKSDVSGI